MSTVVTGSAEGWSGWTRKRAPRAPSKRAWAREESDAYDALLEAQDYGSGQLAEEARRAFVRVTRRPGRRPRCRA